jgi:ribosomal protein S18 acetylase RimI-like enzyme
LLLFGSEVITTTTEMKLVAASNLTGPRLTALFNATYRDYLVPLVFDEDGMNRHLVNNDIDLAVSRVALAPDPVGFALIGRRQRDAWVGGMGTVPEVRRRGVAQRTLDAALQTAMRDGAETVRLEVLEDNEAAISLYQRLGFKVTRRLIVCSLRDLDPPRAEWRPIRVDDARGWIGGQRLSREPWQRADPVLARIDDTGGPLAAISIRDAGEIAAVLIYAGGPSGTSILQMAARDAEIGAEGLRAVGAAAAGPIRMLNFPADEPAADAVARLGIAPDHVQFEMQMRIVASPRRDAPALNLLCADRPRRPGQG